MLQNDSEVLERIQISFHTMVRARKQDGMQPIEITCFFEELPLSVIGSVSTPVPGNFSHNISLYAVISLEN